MQDAKNIICNIVICPHQMHLVVSSVKNYILCIFKKKTKTQPTKKKSLILTKRILFDINNIRVCERIYFKVFLSVSDLRSEI